MIQGRQGWQGHRPLLAPRARRVRTLREVSGPGIRLNTRSSKVVVTELKLG